MMETMNILCCTDDKYAPYYGIMLTSLFDNNKEESFCIYVMTSGLKSETIDMYRMLCSQHHSTLHIIQVDESKVKNCPIREGDHVSLAAYYRIIAPLFIKDIDKILYLDGDIIINDSLRPLWEIDIDNYALGAVIDEVYYDIERHETLGIDIHKSYFNSGVLLINLKYWHKHQIMDRCMKCIETKADILFYHDQDTLNIVLQDEVKFLPLKYNIQYGFIMKYLYNKLEDHVKSEIMSMVHNPTIIHFSGPSKPWHKRSRLPYTSVFLYYKGISLWRNQPLEGSF